MKNIKCRLGFAFVLGSIYSALIKDVGKTYNSSYFAWSDATVIALTILLFTFITVLATVEHIKNK